jgi:ABC-type transport system involved in multi-copper enzyme maturation permease subunit
MFRTLLWTQWKWSRAVVFAGSVGCFAIPLLSLRAAAQGHDPGSFLAYMQMWSVAYSLAAAGLGLLLAMTAWSSDHRGRHVYALSLPVPRWRYVTLRFAAGLTLLLVPVGATLVSALIVSASDVIPTGLHAYPLALTVRFALAALVSYSLFFAIWSGTSRTAGLVLGALAAVWAVQVLVWVAGAKVDVVGRLLDLVFISPGFLAVFGGRWMLIDV